MISNIFYYFIKLFAISSRTKSIQQGLYFLLFFKRATSSKNIIKNKIGIVIKFCKCYVVKWFPSNSLSKTQLKKKTELFSNWVEPGKNKIGIAIKFCKCYVIKRCSSNLSNKIQLKIKIKTEFFINWVGPGKNKIGIAIKFCKCYVIKRSPSNFSNKTQLKKLKIEFFFNQVGPGSMHLALDRTQSGQNSSRNSGGWFHCSCE